MSISTWVLPALLTAGVAGAVGVVSVVVVVPAVGAGVYTRRDSSLKARFRTLIGKLVKV